MAQYLYGRGGTVGGTVARSFTATIRGTIAQIV
jgi:hypothetical protein